MNSSDATTIDISCSAICKQPPVQVIGLLGICIQNSNLIIT